MKVISITGIDAGELVNELLGWHDAGTVEAITGEALQEAGIMAFGEDFWEVEESFDWTTTPELAEVVRLALLDREVEAAMADDAEHREDRRIEGN